MLGHLQSIKDTPSLCFYDKTYPRFWMKPQSHFLVESLKTPPYPDSWKTLRQAPSIFSFTHPYVAGCHEVERGRGPLFSSRIMSFAWIALSNSLAFWIICPLIDFTELHSSLKIPLLRQLQNIHVAVPKRSDQGICHLPISFLTTFKYNHLWLLALKNSLQLSGSRMLHQMSWITSQSLSEWRLISILNHKALLTNYQRHHRH